MEPSQHAQTPLPHASSRSKMMLAVGAVLLLTLGFAGGWYTGQRNMSAQLSISPPPTVNEVACTSEALLCPDGSAVGRSGPNCEFAPCPTVPLTAPTGSQYQSATSTPQISEAPTQSIPTISTSGWKTVSHEGISFQVPESSRTEIFEDSVLIYHAGIPLPDRITIVPYNGGSRRQQFFSRASYDECNWVIQEGKFGSVNALQIAADGGWCQGGAGGTVAVIGSKLVIYEDLYYDLNTKQIYRFEIRDTIISTLKSV